MLRADEWLPHPDLRDARKPGGLSTIWKRKGYTIGTSGWLTGSAPGLDVHRFWQELGAIQGSSFIGYEEYSRIEGRDGQVFTRFTDIDRLAQHMAEIAPEDEGVIAEFVGALRAFTQFQQPVDKPLELYTPQEQAAMMESMGAVMGMLGKWMGMPLQDFAGLFKNSLLRDAFGEAGPLLFFDPNVSVAVALISLATMHQKVAGYPVGGFQQVVDPNEQRHLDLGGSIHYRSPVTTILVEADPSGQGDRATGVRLADGTEHRGDIVVSAADGRTTTFDMLGGKYLSDDIAGYYDGPPVFPSLVLVSLGVDRSFGGLPVSVAGEIFPLDEPITIGGQNAHWLGVHSLSFAPEAAPAGKTLLRVMFGADYEYWSDLREQDRKRYWAEKAQIADQMIAQLDRRFPGLAPQVEMRDVATPATFGRYTGNWKGSMMGWLLTARTMSMHMSKTLPGLTDL